MQPLFKAAQVGQKTIKNRVVVPPMVCFKWSDELGLVSKAHLEHYESLAKGGAGMIVLEAHCIDPMGRLSLDQLGIWSDHQIEGLKEIVKRCQAAGSTVIVQIHHAGEKRAKGISEQPFSVNDLTLESVREIQMAYRAAARRVLEAGADGIELHGAHGYLISQFISPLVNKREDHYGGSFENRMRFAKEIIEGIRADLDHQLILSCRMGGNEPGLAEGIEIAKAYEAAGLDMLHVSAGISGETNPEAPSDFPHNWIVYMGTEIRKVVNIPVIVVNGIRTFEQANHLITADLADFAALGRAHLVDPEWSVKQLRGEMPVTCLECKPCQWFKDGKNCPRVKQSNR